jgi:hypothetical protein
MSGDGLLSLQMGAVTGAVDDLIHGYDQLVSSLPLLAQKVNGMQSETEMMANRLEVAECSFILLP